MMNCMIPVGLQYFYEGFDSRVVFVEVFRMRDVRETVRVELTAFGSKVGLNVIFKFRDLQLPSIFREYLRGLGQDLRLRC